MPASTRDTLRNQLRNGQIAPLYLLFGAEFYLRDLAAKTIADICLKDAQLREFNETITSLTEADFQYAIAAAEQLPMMASRRVVVIRDINKLKEADEDVLSAYVGRPAETSVVIFIAEELDKRRRFVKTLLDSCVSVEFTALSDGELISWANNKLRELGVRADEPTVRQIVALVGRNVLRLTTEIEKLATAVLPETVLTMETVEQLVPNSRELSNFELTDHLFNKDRTKALRILKKILDDGAEPLMLLGLIASNFHKLYLAKEMMRNGSDRSEVAKTLRLPYGKQEEFLAAARRSDSTKLSGILRRLAETDLAIKTSKGTPRMQIEVLVAEITGHL